MSGQSPVVGESQQQQSTTPPPAPLVFYDAAAVLCVPVTPQQVTAFSPRERGQAALLLPDGSEYYGEMLLDQPHGLGVMLFKSTSLLYGGGDRYGGMWKHGLFHGEGVLLTSAYTYQGGWFEGKMHGHGQIMYSRRVTDLVMRGISALSAFERTHTPLEYTGEFHHTHHRHGRGMMRYANGDVYNGDWASNRRHGQGRLVTDDGEVYEGQWSKDERHGYGKINYVDGGEFKGMMVHDKQHGEGVMMFPNGDEYYGTFTNNRIHGQGTMRYKNGDVYEGMWKHGLRNGEGKYTLRKKGATVEGCFVNGLIQGRGVVQHPGVSTFVGEFDRGERRHGTLFWHDTAPSDKACYQGEWLGETMHNRGLLWYRNGDFFFGRFVKNKRHGAGNVRYADGTEFSGNFVNDLREGQGVLQAANGSIQAGLWRGDVFVEGYDGEWDGISFNGIGHLLLREPPAAVSGGGNTGTNNSNSNSNATNATATGSSLDGATALTNTKPLFEHFGLFRHGARHGAGVLRLAGHVLMGSWVQDVLECETGSWEFPSGDVYMGGFQKGLRNGPNGCIWLTDGSYFCGSWQLDAPVGSGTFHATDRKRPIYAPKEEAADAASTAAITNTADDDDDNSSNDKNSSSWGMMGLLVSLFRRRASPADKDTRRIVGYREHYVLKGEWDLAPMSYTLYQSLLARDGSSGVVGAPFSSGGNDGVVSSSSSGGGGGGTGGSGGVALCKPPMSIALGLQERSGVVVFKSGVCVRTEWLHNYPRLMLPHRPDAPFHNKIYGADRSNSGSVGSVGGQKSCTFCDKPFTFFRKATSCALCGQRSCSSCLNPIDVRGHPQIEALLRLRMDDSMVGDAGVVAENAVVAVHVPACVDCARTALLGVEFNVIWIPARSSTSLSEKSEDTLEAAETAMTTSTAAETSLMESSEREAPEPSTEIPESMDIVYEGYTCNGVPHIYGSLWWCKKGYYLGAFHEGHRHGRGVQMIPNGEKYVGYFNNDAWHGAGTYCADDGSVYEGVWERGKLLSVHYHGEVDGEYRRHGRGQSYEADGSRYNGEWQHGERHGTGILQSGSGAVYSGEFAFGQVEGEGKLLLSASVFYGTFRGGKKHGKGTERFGECVVEGEWHNDLLSGFVRVYDGLAEAVYETTYHSGNERDDCFAPPVMVSDVHSQSCAQCGTAFSLFLRRHHCRLCGEVVCDSCSQHRAVMPQHFKVDGHRRVCDRCYQRLEQRRMLGIRRFSSGEVYAGCWSQGKWVARGLLRRADGSVVVMDGAGKPLVQGASNNSLQSTAETATPMGAGTTTLTQDSQPLDATPDVEVLRQLPASTSTEVDAFTLWWSMMLSVVGLSVPLELTPVTQFVFPRPPVMKPLKLFSVVDGDNDDTAAVRARRYIPAIPPSAPQLPTVAAAATRRKYSVPPRPFIAEDDVLRRVTNERMLAFPTYPPPSESVGDAESSTGGGAGANDAVVLSCYRRTPLLPPTPQRPSPGSNERVAWDDWQARGVPQYNNNNSNNNNKNGGGSTPNLQRWPSEWQHVPFACPFMPPVVADIERAVRGDAALWRPLPFSGPQAFTLIDTHASGVVVEQRVTAAIPANAQQ
ncbi:hypothetical protein DQ04_07111010 [Trypanosoma grayi]|uniref:hypothetical protein n=1 Tax=Trypanosoma grayi TaxID=71804 RepID=UPI0004F449FF|nr:hypothetical protein DQ04_07111010 [Trypanosoma grayi]KEG08471.1 hypothetical protein DQ04_07111010 [Trypanosoma grayi]